MKMVAPQKCSLLELLAMLSPDSSKTTLRSWLEQDRVTVNGKAVKRGDTQVAKGQHVAVGRKAQYAHAHVKILFEDNHLVVVEKPEGLLSVGTNFNKRHHVQAILKERKERLVYPVHRLDRETSGVMVFAYSQEAREGLKKQFFHHTIEREYHALVEGKVEPDQGTWESFLQEDENYVVSSHPTEGQKAITHYKVIKFTKSLSLLRLTLETGRKNQIRVHCQDAGHPIFGDKKYGAKIIGFSRLCLHASKLTFIHPVTQKKLKFLSPLPESLAKI